MKIIVCFPFYIDFKMLKPFFRECFLQGKHQFVFSGGRQSGVPRWARNHSINHGTSIQKYQKLPAEISGDYHLMLDPDTIPVLSTIERMLELDQDVVCAPYLKQGSLIDLEVGNFGEILGHKKPPFTVYDHGVKQVDWFGGGCTLIKSHVWEKLEYPWYRQVMIDFGNNNQEECSEDVGFCINLKNAGIDAYCDLDNRVIHVPKPRINWDMWEGASEYELALRDEKNAAKEKDGPDKTE